MITELANNDFSFISTTTAVFRDSFATYIQSKRVFPRRIFTNTRVEKGLLLLLQPQQAAAPWPTRRWLDANDVTNGLTDRLTHTKYSNWYQRSPRFRSRPPAREFEIWIPTAIIHIQPLALDSLSSTVHPLSVIPPHVQECSGKVRSESDRIVYSVNRNRLV